MENRITASNYWELLGFSIQRMENGEAQASLPDDGRLMNSLGIMHGGAIASLADTTCGAALKSAIDNEHFFVTTDLQISYFKAARGGELVCTAKVIHLGKQTARVEAELFVNEVRVAKAGGSFTLLKKQDKKL
ncbi:MAG: PaaI family thioesterase [Pseudomonadales bacterium]|nr:PaaI family thioesterase [Pseudomonadales bacterium]